MSEELDVTSIFAKLSHDLKNDFIIIRAAAGSIKKNLIQPEIIEKKIELINEVLNQAISNLDAARDSLLKYEESNTSSVK